MGWLSSKVFRSLSNAIQHILVPEEAHCSDPFWLSRCPPLLRDKRTLSEAILMPLKSSYPRGPQPGQVERSSFDLYVWRTPRQVCCSGPNPKQPQSTRTEISVVSPARKLVNSRSSRPACHPAV